MNWANYSKKKNKKTKRDKTDSAHVACRKIPTECIMKFTKKESEVKTESQIGASNNKLSLTIDTGAQFSILKAEKLTPNCIIKRGEKVCLIGITRDKPIETLGKIYTSILFDNKSLVFGFQVVDKSLNLETDGIIGSDSLSHFSAKMDFATNTLALYDHPDNSKEQSIKETNTIQICQNDMVNDEEKAYANAVADYLEYEEELENTYLMEYLIDKPIKNKPKYNKKFYDMTTELQISL